MIDFDYEGKPKARHPYSPVPYSPDPERKAATRHVPNGSHHLFLKARQCNELAELDRFVSLGKWAWGWEGEDPSFEKLGHRSVAFLNGDMRTRPPYR